MPPVKVLSAPKPLLSHTEPPTHLTHVSCDHCQLTKAFYGSLSIRALTHTPDAVALPLALAQVPRRLLGKARCLTWE